MDSDGEVVHPGCAICKNAAVDILEHYKIAHCFKPVVFRHLTVYGWHPNAEYLVNGVKKVLPWRQIMAKCIAGDLVEVWGDPSRKKELLYIDDFTRAIRLAVESDVCGLYNLPGNRPYTLEEQVQGLIDVFSPSGSPSPKIYCPEKPSTPQNLLSGDKVYRMLSWRADISWHEACRRMKSEMQANIFGLLWGK